MYALLYTSLTCRTHITKLKGGTGVSTDTIVGVCVCVECSSPARTPNANH